MIGLSNRVSNVLARSFSAARSVVGATTINEAMKSRVARSPILREKPKHVAAAYIDCEKW
jgi:hypothetical protein